MKAKLTIPEPRPTDVTLTMSLEEASLLKKFAGQVSGGVSRGGSTRKFYNLFGDIYTSLGEVTPSSADFVATADGYRRNTIRIEDR